MPVACAAFASLALLGLVGGAGPGAPVTAQRSLPPVDTTVFGATGRLPDPAPAPAPRPAPDPEAPWDTGPGSAPRDGGGLGIPETVLAAYHGAATTVDRSAPGCRLSWPLIAGIGKVESSHASGGAVDAAGTTRSPILGPRLTGSGGNAAIPDTDRGTLDHDPVWDRAVGPTQFIPSSWRTYGADGNGDGLADPDNVFDAGLATGRYLCSGGGDLSSADARRDAVFRYNHSQAYVTTVLRWADAYASGALPVPDTTTPSTSGDTLVAGAPTLAALPEPVTPGTMDAPAPKDPVPGAGPAAVRAPGPGGGPAAVRAPGPGGGPAVGLGPVPGAVAGGPAAVLGPTAGGRVPGATAPGPAGPITESSGATRPSAGATRSPSSDLGSDAPPAPGTTAPGTTAPGTTAPENEAPVRPVPPSTRPSSTRPSSSPAPPGPRPLPPPGATSGPVPASTGESAASSTPAPSSTPASSAARPPTAPRTTTRSPAARPSVARPSAARPPAARPSVGRPSTTTSSPAAEPTRPSTSADPARCAAAAPAAARALGLPAAEVRATSGSGPAAGRTTCTLRGPDGPLLVAVTADSGTPAVAAAGTSRTVAGGRTILTVPFTAGVPADRARAALAAVEADWP